MWYPETGKQKAVAVIVALLVNFFLPRERVVACWEKVKGLFRPLEHS